MSRRSSPKLRATLADRHRVSSSACPSALPLILRRPEPGRHGRSSVTASCRPIKPCSIARAQIAPPTLPWLAPNQTSSDSLSSSNAPAGPSSTPASSGPQKTSSAHSSSCRHRLPMSEAPRSNRPTPRTTAAVEAELRRRIRAELTQARSDADGELDDAALASVIASAIAAALSWHLESPEHTRNATTSSRTWRPAGGPRGGASGPRDFGERPPRENNDQREFRPRRPPFGKAPPKRGGGGFGPRRPPPRSR